MTSRASSSALRALKAPDCEALRGVLGQFATGVTVVTARAGAPCGMTANAFTSVSLDPPLALVCVTHGAAIYKTILQAGAFGISVLAADQEHHARYFADYARPRGDAEFEGIDWHPGPGTGVPIIAGALASLECRLADVHRGGDHSIFLGEIVSISRGPARAALVFFQGGFHRLAARTADAVPPGTTTSLPEASRPGVAQAAAAAADWLESRRRHARRRSR